MLASAPLTLSLSHSMCFSPFSSQPAFRLRNSHIRPISSVESIGAQSHLRCIFFIKLDYNCIAIARTRWPRLEKMEPGGKNDWREWGRGKEVKKLMRFRAAWLVGTYLLYHQSILLLYFFYKHFPHCHGANRYVMYRVNTSIMCDYCMFSSFIQTKIYFIILYFPFLRSDLHLVMLI